MAKMPEDAVPPAATAWPAAAMTLETALAASPAAAGQPAHAGAAAAAAAPSARLRTGLWLLLAIGLLPALAGTAWYMHQLRALALRDAFAQADLMANGAAEALRWQVQDAQAMLAQVAARPRVRALDPADCDPLFRDFQSLVPAHKALALRRNSGESVCSELPNPPRRDAVVAAPWFQAALQQGGFLVSGVHLGAVQQVWTVRFSQPVTGRSGQAEGLLISPLDLQQLHRRLFARLPPQARVAVVDGSNRLVLQSQQQQARVGKPAVENVAREIEQLRRLAADAADGAIGTVVADGAGGAVVRRFIGGGFDGPSRLFVLRPVPQTDWVVTASLPESETLQGYRRTRNGVLAAVLLVLLGVAAAAWRVGRGILDPISGLADAARGVAAGDDNQRAPEWSPREIAQVAREFNRMVVANGQARAQLQASEEQYRTLIQHLPVAVVTHRPDSAIEVFNDRACSLLRLGPAQMRGRTAQDGRWFFIDAEGRRLPPEAYPVSRLLQTRQPLLPTLLGIVSDLPDARAPAPAPDPASAAGEAPAALALAQAHTWVMVTGYPQFDGPGVLQRAIVAFVDVTDQRQAEALRVAKETAETASRAKSRFLSRVSHELRTPLNAIIGFSELMLMDEQVPPASKDKLRHVLNAGRHLLALINQVLDLTQVEAAGPPAAQRPVALWPLLAECVALCGPLAQARGVVLGLPPPPEPAPWVLGDPTPLRQVLINLLSNAIKYNQPEGAVLISCARQDGGDTVLLQIRDTGPGLSEAQQAGLFQPFNRLGAEYSGVEGHGLGLSIARMLAQAMGGDITAQSAAGEGATFSLRLRGSAPG